LPGAADQVDNEEDDENVAALGLGELADLTVFNEADTSAYDVSENLFLPLLSALDFSHSIHTACFEPPEYKVK